MEPTYRPWYIGHTGDRVLRTNPFGRENTYRQNGSKPRHLAQKKRVKTKMAKASRRAQR